MAEAHWYVVHTYSGYENKVKANIDKTIENRHLEDQILEVRVPMQEVVELKNGAKKSVSKKMFPGYVLINMVMNDDTWHLVKNTPRVTGFLGGNRPAPLADHEIAAILQTQEATAEKPRPKISFEVGEIVRLKEGAFADFNGRIEEVDYDRSRLRVTVEIFGRETPVDISFSGVEKI